MVRAGFAGDPRREPRLPGAREVPVDVAPPCAVYDQLARGPAGPARERDVVPLPAPQIRPPRARRPPRLFVGVCAGAEPCVLSRIVSFAYFRPPPAALLRRDERPRLRRGEAHRSERPDRLPLDLGKRRLDLLRGALRRRPERVRDPVPLLLDPSKICPLIIRMSGPSARTSR